MKKLYISIALVLVSAFYFTCAWAGYGHITDDQAVHVILGAASDQNDEVMRSIAHALRNRDSLEGIGEADSYILGISEIDKDRALDAWTKSLQENDSTGGANRWLHDPSDGNFIRPRYVPKWQSDNNFRTKIGPFKFFKEDLERKH